LTSWTSRLREYDPFIRFLLAVTFFLVLSRAMTIPFLAILMARRGMSPAEIGSMIGSGVLLGSLSGVVAGRFSDLAPRRCMFNACLCCFGVGIASVGLATGRWDTFAAVLLVNLAHAAYEPVCNALIADRVTGPQRVAVFSMRYVVTNVAFAVGPFIGAALDVSHNQSVFLWAGSIYGLVAAVSVVSQRRNLPTPPGAEKPASPQVGHWRVLLRDRRLICFVAAGLLAVTVYGEISVYLSQAVAPRFGERAFAALIGVNAVTVSLSQLVVVPLLRRYGPARLVTVGCLLLGCGQIGFAVSPSFLGLAVSMVLLSIGEAILIPADYSLLVRIAPAQLRGSYFGAHALVNFGSALGPFVTGVLISTQGAASMFLTLGAISLLSLAFYHWGWQLSKTARQNGVEDGTQ
jgi:MFS family permease